MSAHPTTDGGRTETATSTEFDAAMQEAREVAALDGLGPRDVPVPESDYKTDTFTGSLVLWASPSSTLIRAFFDEPNAHEVDGAAPGDDAPRTERTFLTEQALDDGETETDMTFRVVARWTNSYDDERFTVETPAPWDVPESFEGDDPNEVVKSLEWGDHHYTFDEDDRAAPSEADEAWSLDKSAAAPLKEAAEAAGYEWVVAATDEQGDADETEDALDRLAEFAEQDDGVRVRYAKKNGNGVGVYEGAIDHADVRGESSGQYGGLTAHETVVAFHDSDGKAKSIKRDDGGTVAMFSTGHYPFMGEVLSVEVVPGEYDLSDI
jgi:hypothetical protein